MAGPVSAFAARETTRRTIGRVTSHADAGVSQVIEANNETLVESLHPRKKEKRHKNLKNPDPSLLQPPIGLANDHVESPDEEEDAGDDGGDIAFECSEHELSSQSAVLVQRLSTFDHSRSEVLSETETEWRIRLHPKDSLAILGQYDIWVRSGAISVYGAVIHASSKLHRVYAPSTHSIPPIRAIANPFGSSNQPIELTIISCGSRIKMLRQIAPKIGRIWNGKPISGTLVDLSKRSFANLEITAQDPHKRSLRLLDAPPDWPLMISRLMSNMDERPIAAMVCGPKGAGKSTFCKLLVNALVSRGATPHQSGGRALGGSVAFLDLDPGQPEYSPPGELSLFKLQSCNFGPSFTHPTIKSESDQLVRAHYFGHISPKDDPCHYYKCALDLFDHYQRISTTSYASLPLIVNSSGWIQGNGLKLLADLIKGFLLTDVIYMSTSGPGEVIGVLAEATNRVNIQFHQLASQASEASTKSAADLRMMQTLSYFHLDLSDEDNKELRWDPWPITRRAPLVVHYAGIQQGISAVMVLGDEQKSEFMESILDGCLVGLVATEAGIGKDPQEIPQSDREATHANGSQRIEDVRETPSIIRTATGVPYIVSAHHTSIPLSPEGSRCIGQALIRGIDTKTKTFQLLTSVSVGVILACCPNIVLVRGNLDTPTWAYREDFELAQAQRRLRSRILGVDEDFGKLEMQNWAVKQPWADVVDGGRKNSGKVRRIRRDIKYKPQAGDITV